MKKAPYFLLLLLSIACQPDPSKNEDNVLANGNLEELQALKKNYAQALTDTKGILNRIEARIADLDTQKKLPLITSTVMEKESFDHYVKIQADMKTRKNVVLFPEIPGSLLKFYVQEGQSVKKGTLLAVINDGGLQEQLAQLELQLELAKTTYERSQRLWEQNIGTEIQYLETKTRYQSQQKMVAQMQEQVAKSKIYAPFDGTIDELLANEGANLSPGATPLLRLINLQAMYAEAQLPETYIKNIRVGTPTRIELPMLDKLVDTQIQTIGNFINPGNRTFRVEAPLANPDGLIKPNLMGKMNINDYSNPEALMVPQRVIRESTSGEPYVFVLQPTDEENVFTTQKQFVVLGKSSDEKTEILAGLQAGDRIVIEGVSSLEDGQKVRNLNR